jgi:hypothetical protein
VVLTTSSAITLLGFWMYDFMLPGPPHPYVGILLFLILPGVFVLGLILMDVEPVYSSLTAGARRYSNRRGVSHGPPHNLESSQILSFQVTVAIRQYTGNFQSGIGRQIR